MIGGSPFGRAVTLRSAPVVLPTDPPLLASHRPQGPCWPQSSPVVEPASNISDFDEAREGLKDDGRKEGRSQW
jgi:hypothetical protein